MNRCPVTILTHRVQVASNQNTARTTALAAMWNSPVVCSQSASTNTTRPRKPLHTSPMNTRAGAPVQAQKASAGSQEHEQGARSEVGIAHRENAKGKRRTLGGGEPVDAVHEVVQIHEPHGEQHQNQVQPTRWCGTARPRKSPAAPRWHTRRRLRGSSLRSSSRPTPATTAPATSKADAGAPSPKRDASANHASMATTMPMPATSRRCQPHANCAALGAATSPNGRAKSPHEQGQNERHGEGGHCPNARDCVDSRHSQPRASCRCRETAGALTESPAVDRYHLATAPSPSASDSPRAPKEVRGAVPCRRGANASNGLEPLPTRTSARPNAATHAGTGQMRAGASSPSPSSRQSSSKVTSSPSRTCQILHRACVRRCSADGLQGMGQVRDRNNAAPPPRQRLRAPVAALSAIAEAAGSWP